MRIEAIPPDCLTRQPMGKAASATPLAHHLKTRDFDELAHAFRHWDAGFEQIGRGAFHGELHQIQLVGMQVLRVAVDRGLHARGTHKPGSYVFSLVTPGNSAATWKGCHLHPGQIRINHPGELFDHLTGTDYENLAVQIDAELLWKRADILCGIDLEEHLARVSAVSVDRGSFAALEECVRQLLDQARVSSVRLTPPENVQSIEQICIRQLLHALTSADPSSEPALGMTSRQRAVRRAEEFMLAHLEHPLSAEDLCAEVGVSERTLRYAFRDLFGLSPMAYFKTKKLNAVRHALKTMEPAGITLHEIAQRWGFEHTGNFAADYRRLFGELPSETLGR